MNASEPVMDAVEKVAREIRAAEWTITPWGTPPDWADVADEDRHDYLAMASHLLAAFPQLALEGREEWAYQYQQYTPTQVADRGSAVAVKKRANNSDMRAVARTVWESPWSEVQS